MKPQDIATQKPKSAQNLHAYSRHWNSKWVFFSRAKNHLLGIFCKNIDFLTKNGQKWPNLGQFWASFVQQGLRVASNRKSNAMRPPKSGYGESEYITQNLPRGIWTPNFSKLAKKSKIKNTLKMPKIVFLDPENAQNRVFRRFWAFGSLSEKSQNSDQDPHWPAGRPKMAKIPKYA